MLSKAGAICLVYLNICPQINQPSVSIEGGGWALANNDCKWQVTALASCLQRQLCDKPWNRSAVSTMEVIVINAWAEHIAFPLPILYYLEEKMAYTTIKDSVL